MTTEEIKAIIGAHRLRLMSRDIINKKGNGKHYEYLSIGKYDPATKKFRSFGLGRLDRMGAMRPEQLLEFITAKFGDLVKQP
ncbi:hypothetical protein [Tengunoibacter tsumagoiensis]|uniref:Uncharacterized protein n=1 Tax=Tengunoibacter tsumagoiensis TaxID=2014871 RepID=A0A402A4Z8_9CHLR|nr:hypothetical protein [Tengunoibacter tsumagoiensis]GCE14169.1 hypothetical protein KTT_40280 [Tengunoibacter tsumagoiensis]GCE14223.1 hypothetical protein KTT_40820 [Tengunoibacter tsumagoiensis]